MGSGAALSWWRWAAPSRFAIAVTAAAGPPPPHPLRLTEPKREGAQVRRAARGIRGARRLPRGGIVARSPRGALALHRQGRARIHAHAAARREARLHARGHEGQGVAAQRMGVVVRLV